MPSGAWRVDRSRPQPRQGAPGTGRAASPRSSRPLLIFPAGLWYLCCSSRRSSSSSSSASATGRRTAATRRRSRSTTTPASSATPGAVHHGLWMALAGTIRVPARRPAARVLHRDPRRPPQGPVHPAARHPVLDELPDPDLRLAHRSSGRRASAGSSATLIGDPTSASWARRRRCSWASSTATCR